MTRSLPSLLVVLLATSVVMATACDGRDARDDDVGEDDDTLADDDAGDDDASSDIEMVDSHPTEGDTDFYHRNVIRVGFSGELESVNILLREQDTGVEIPGEVAMEQDQRHATFDPYGTTPDSHLLPVTGYEATVEWPGQAPVTISFSTSDTGTPLSDPGVVVGRDYRLDHAFARLISPDVGGWNCMSPPFSHSRLAIHVTESAGEGSSLRGFLAHVSEQDSRFVQDLCSATFPIDETAGVVWENPHFAIGSVGFGPDDYAHYTDIAWIYYVPLLFEGVTVEGSFTPDGESIDGVAIEGTFDSRVYDSAVDPDGEEGAACALLNSMGIECEACPGDSSEFCLYLSIYDMPGDHVEVVAEDPETGVEFIGLQEVTHEMLDGWRAGGHCQ